ncbi:MAG: hypothetical protein CMN76_21070 [Spirochaetaceae bacterium]|nr:hypothetical protein [Spirochaetaceae bacterium]|tara:strand:+ start:47246 stop:48349 length:1104 start_codon:yes stop_codon:yes gene_type:complete
MKEFGENIAKITLAILLSLGLGLQFNCSAEELAALQGEEEEEVDLLDQLIQEWILFELFDAGGGACNIQQGLLLETLFQRYIEEGGTLPAPDAPSGDAAANPHYDPIGDQPLEGLGEEKLMYLPTKYGVQPITVNEYHGNYVSESDIIFAPDQLFEYPDTAENYYFSVGIDGSDSGRWPVSNGFVQVPYQINPALPGETVNEINQAIAHWQERSRFRFVVRSSQSDYIYFTDNDTGCNSYVGRISSQPQHINLAPNCGFGAAVHEIGHAMGLWHEQTRLDRDEYVNVYLDRTTNSSQYTKKVAGDAYDIGAYDFESIMHYGSFYFASGDQPVMTKKDGSIIEPNRRALTDCDVYGAEELHFNSSAYN